MAASQLPDCPSDGVDSFVLKIKQETSLRRQQIDSRLASAGPSTLQTSEELTKN